MQYEKAKEYILARLESELDPLLTYHTLGHTLDVAAVVLELVGLSALFTDKEVQLLSTAAYFHDAGFLTTRLAHEQEGCNLVRTVLPAFNYSEKDIECINAMILATRIPQSPKNEMEKILCDADLDYLGRSDFKKIGATLFQELSNFGIIDSEIAWNNLQVSFLKSHQYHTVTNQLRREPVKQDHLLALETICATYGKE